MSRVVSIEPSEPGLYVVTVLRSEAQPLGKILESIAHPPIDDVTFSPGMSREGDDTARSVAPGSSRNGRRRSAGGH